MAAPQVAGATALVKSVNPSYNANQLKSTLKRVASVPDEYNKKYYGSGYLDTYSAVVE
ncbi:S8 family serine peptidase [Halospeciosus flavus]